MQIPDYTSLEVQIMDPQQSFGHRSLVGKFKFHRLYFFFRTKLSYLNLGLTLLLELCDPYPVC